MEQHVGEISHEESIQLAGNVSVVSDWLSPFVDAYPDMEAVLQAIKSLGKQCDL